MPSQEEIATTAQDAIDSYKRYERKRLLLFYGAIAVASALLMMLDVYLVRIV